MSPFRKTLLGVGIIFLSLQFIRPVKNQAAGPDPRDILVQHPAPPAVKELLQNACYDCHSNTTRYPWYAEIQPLSSWLSLHIIQGKEKLNFSTFFDYKPKRADLRLEACIDAITAHEMPLPSYRLAHPDARLTPAQIQLLTDWFTGVRSRILSTVPEAP
jgi:Haem-binding domain